MPVHQPFYMTCCTTANALGEDCDNGHGIFACFLDPEGKFAAAPCGCLPAQLLEIPVHSADSCAGVLLLSALGTEDFVFCSFILDFINYSSPVGHKADPTTTYEHMSAI